MNIHNFIYKNDPNLITVYANDILISNQANITRLSFLDTKMPLPKSSILDENGNFNMSYDEKKYMEKTNKCEIVVPTELIPNIIDSLNKAYNIYQEFKNKK